MPRILWHYTSGDNLRKILRARVLLPSPEAGARLPALWFSARRDWDPAVGLAGTGAPLTFEARFRAAQAWLSGGGPHAATRVLAGSAEPIDAGEVGGLARIGVAPETAPLSWPEFRRVAGYSPAGATAREELDRAVGSNPDDWRISVEPVPAPRWLAIEVRPGTRSGEHWKRLLVG